MMYISIMMFPSPVSAKSHIILVKYAFGFSSQLTSKSFHSINGHQSWRDFIHEAPLQLAVGHITGCMIVSNESLEEDCHKTWLQLIFGLNRGSYDAWRWKHSIEVAHEQLQVKGGTFSNDERWGIVGGWCKILVQVKGGGLSVAVASERRDVF